MVSLFQQELQSLQEEMTTSFEKLQDRLTDLARRSEEVERCWETRVVELEDRVTEILSHSRLITHQNAELKRKVAQQKPEMEKVIDARLAAFRKLRNAYRVIVDLAERVIDGDLAQSTEEELGEVLMEAYNSMEGPQARDSSPESDGTIHGRDQDHRKNSEPFTPAGRLEEPYHSSASSVDDNPTSASAINSSPGSSSLSIDAPQSQTSATSEGPWRIHYSRIPGSSEGNCGPVSPDMLVQCLGLKEELCESLERLRSQDEFRLRVYIEGSFAFVYDPIFLETKSQTLLLDWGGDLVNESIAKYITLARDKNPVFHTFVFPVQKNRWHYVGAHTWDVEEFPPAWPEMGLNSRRRIVRKLWERSHENVDEQDIVRRLDNRELQEVYVRISSTGLYERSRDMARKMGFDTNDAGTGASPRSEGTTFDKVLPAGGSSAD